MAYGQQKCIKYIKVQASTGRTLAPRLSVKIPPNRQIYVRTNLWVSIKRSYLEHFNPLFEYDSSL